MSYFLLAGLLIVTGGSPKDIEFPSFMNGLSRISEMVNLLDGSATSIFFIKSVAYFGTSINLGN